MSVGSAQPGHDLREQAVMHEPIPLILRGDARRLTLPRAVEWIDDHEQEIRAALTERKTG